MPPSKPIPGDPAYHCAACRNTPGKENRAPTHYTKDCPLLSPSQQRLCLLHHDRALKNRRIIPTDRDPSVGQQTINVAEAYYQLQPVTPDLRPSIPGTTDQPIPYRQEHYCSRCWQSPTGRLQALTHFTIDCPDLDDSERTLGLQFFDRVLRDRRLRQEDRHPKVREAVNIVEAYYGLCQEAPGSPEEENSKKGAPCPHQMETHPPEGANPTADCYRR